jgi:hypothetical protein
MAVCRARSTNAIVGGIGRLHDAQTPGTHRELGTPRPHDARHYADGWVMRPATAFPLLVAAEPVLPSA